MSIVGRLIESARETASLRAKREGAAMRLYEGRRFESARRFLVPVIEIRKDGEGVPPIDADVLEHLACLDFDLGPPYTSFRYIETVSPDGVKLKRVFRRID